uniref:Ribonuclease kappa n=1 Tax=Panagrolaimus sp. JU765 TaxID=591449 RepID=A0AC34Q2M6_9BILA
MGCLSGLTGPMCTGFLLMVSIWGIIFLAVVGFLFNNHSVGLMEDLPEEDDKHADWSVRYNNILKLYEDTAKNCWFACAGYVVVLIYSSIRMYMIVRAH